MSEPLPGEPDYWPEKPVDAYWTNGGVLNSRRGWTVERTPPPPWPDIAGQPSRSVYGPPGTRWLYYSDDVLDRLNLTWEDVLTQVFQTALKFLKRRFLAPATQYTWVVPGIREGQLMSVQVVRTSIHANIFGSAEELVHVLNWVPGGAPIDDVVPFATTVQAGFHIFVGSISTVLHTGLIYDYVAAALITLDPPDDPSYDLTTEYVNFAETTKGNGANALPNQAALCVSHQTARRGARYRGRTYLGGLSASILEPNGLMQLSLAAAVRDAWIAFVNYVSINTGASFVVASGKFGTAEPVTDERVGQVLDTMRSRRTSLPEAYQSSPLVP